MDLSKSEFKNETIAKDNGNKNNFDEWSKSIQ